MIFCDITMSYNEASGGIRTYLDEKRKYLLEHTKHTHVLIVPADHDDVIRDERSITHHVSSPFVPGHAPYRLFYRPGRISDILLDCRPDIIELGSFYVSAWAAFHHRHRRMEMGEKCLVGAYFHTDVAKAFVSGPLDRLIDDSVGEWSDTLAQVGYQLSSLLSSGVESYLDAVFEHSDLCFAASPPQANRLHQYGVDHSVHVVPLGINLERFHPDRRSQEIREAHGIEPDDILLIYGGRLVEEKAVRVLIEAYQLLPQDFAGKLIIMGEGPLREKLEALSGDDEGIQILPYETDPDRYAELLCSADIYVTAGPHETFGLSVVEAQAAGLPVVGVEAGALTERVVEGTGYLGPVGDAGAFANNIQQAWDNHDELARQSRRHVENNFSWENTFSKLIGIYENSFQSAGVKN